MTAQHYGRCDDVATSPRPLYEWEPRRCALEPFAREASCELLRGKQLLFAGDSTMWQLFLSFVLMHGGQLGRNLVHTSSASDISASCCDDGVRAVFVRSDLLLWSNHHWEYTQARRPTRRSRRTWKRWRKKWVWRQRSRTRHRALSIMCPPR